MFDHIQHDQKTEIGNQEKIWAPRTDKCLIDYPLSQERSGFCGEDKNTHKVVYCGTEEKPLCYDNICKKEDSGKGKIETAGFYNIPEEECKKSYNFQI